MCTVSGMKDNVQKRASVSYKTTTVGTCLHVGPKVDISACLSLYMFVCMSFDTVCVLSGRCVGQQLRCNDEIDCVNQKDETDCDVINRRDTKCSGMLTIPGAEKATQG